MDGDSLSASTYIYIPWSISSIISHIQLLVKTQTSSEEDSIFVWVFFWLNPTGCLEQVSLADGGI